MRFTKSLPKSKTMELTATGSIFFANKLAAYNAVSQEIIYGAFR